MVGTIEAIFAEKYFSNIADHLHSQEGKELIQYLIL
jgi:hypothetical protein